MTQALEIRTPHADVSALVRELAPSVDDLSIRLPCEQPISAGRWVRFVVYLADGSNVFEGIGRAERSRPEGTRFCVHLSQLSFDARNEVMFERLLLARDAAEETANVELHAVGAELVRGSSQSAAPPVPPRPPTMPPPVPSRNRASPHAEPPSPPKPPAIAKPSAGGLADVARRADGTPRRTAPPPLPEHSGRAAPRRRPLHLEVPPRLLAQARRLAPALPTRLTEDPKRTPEEAVLQTALRLGLAALEALRDDETP